MPIETWEGYMGDRMKLREKKYCWSSAKCVRYNEDFSGENHPCYWCGVPPEDMFSPKVVWCMTCGGFRCPSCGKCWCNVSQEESDALKFLRDKYCCNWRNFKIGIVDAGDLHMAGLYVPGFKLALDYCRTKKGFVRGG